MRDELSDLFERGAEAVREQREEGLIPPIYVSQPCYDDMGAALNRLSIPYESLSSVKISHLDDAVVMVNCGCGNYAEKARAIDPFIRGGGSAIVSDLASPVVADLSEATFAGGGSGGTVEAAIVDGELERLLGQSTAPITLTGGYDEPEQIPPDSSVYIRELDGDTPLAYSFPHGDGEVVFTAFHNHEQTSELEEALFAFLLMVPIASVNDQTVTETYTGLVGVENEDAGDNPSESLSVVASETDSSPTTDRQPGSPKNCSNCGTVNDPGETFCTDCGFRLD